MTMVKSQKISGSLKYQHEFEVTSKYPFPLDMLRYDSCFPSRSEDGAQIMWSIDRDNQGLIEPRTVRLVHHDERKHWTPTIGRWSSFLWTVVDDTY
jgi:hypothetical protein